MTTKTLVLHDEASLIAFGRELGQRLVPGDVLFLTGTLGAGKTTLARGILRGRGHEGSVKSPTFTLVEPYEHLEPAVHHFDLYRINDPEELELMGFRDYFGHSILLIEWAERLAGDAAQPTLAIHLEPVAAGRTLVMTLGEHKNFHSIQEIVALFADQA